MSALIYTGEQSESADVIGHWLSDFTEDAIRVMGAGVVAHNTIVDTYASTKAHRDAIQLQPTCPLMPRAQYAGAALRDVEIIGNHIRSKGQLQGIFCSDGLIPSIQVMDNVIQTQSVHFISLAGVLSGFMEGNITAEGKPCPITFYPLRIGGAPDDKNIWVWSFLNPHYRYEPIEEIIADYETDVHRDLRMKLFNTKDTYLKNFDLDSFWQFACEQSAPLDALEHARLIQNWALTFGDPFEQL